MIRAFTGNTNSTSIPRRVRRNRRIADSRLCRPPGGRTKFPSLTLTNHSSSGDFLLLSGLDRICVTCHVFWISGSCGHPGDINTTIINTTTTTTTVWEDYLKNDELSENFRFDRFSLSRRYFPIQPRGADGMTSAVPREQSRTSARSAERTLALDPRPHSSAAARASLRFLMRSATERRTSRGEISFQLPFKRYPIKNFGEQPGGQI